VRRLAATGAALVLTLAGCTAPPGQLPEDPLDRATACTAVRALELSAGKADGGPVSFAGFTELLHFGMLAAAEDGVQVHLNRLFAVSQRAPAVMEQLDDAEWRPLVEPCNAAYPETQRPAMPLPGDPYEAGLTCFGLADIISKTALDYPAERQDVAGLADRALQAAQPVLRERAKNNADAHRIAAGYTARAFKAGRPASLIDQCRRRFPAAP
jgi:hypothetical protein